MKKTLTTYAFLIFTVVPFMHCYAQNVLSSLSGEGFIKTWYVAAPFEQPIEGFGELGDEEIIDETADKNHLLESGSDALNWIPKQIDQNSFLDMKNVFDKVVDNSLSKVYEIKAGYAFAVIDSEKEQTVKAYFGGNSISKIIVNGKRIYSNKQIKNAVKDEIEKEISLRAGENYILLKVFNSHKNYSISFFTPVEYEWGFYFQLTGKDGIHQKSAEGLKNDFNFIPTFFMKEMNGVLKQKIYLDVVSNNYDDVNTALKLNADEISINENLTAKYGHNHYEIYIPVVEEKIKAEAI